MQPCPPYTTRGSALKGAPFRSYVACEMRATRSERNPHPNIGHCADGGASYSMSAWIPTPIFAFSAEFLAFPGFFRLSALPLPPSRPRCGMRWRTGQAPSAPFPSHLLDHVRRALSSPLPFRWPALGLGSVSRASSGGFVKGFGGFLFLAFLARLAARTGVAVLDASVRGVMRREGTRDDASEGRMCSPRLGTRATGGVCRPFSAGGDQPRPYGGTCFAVGFPKEARRLWGCRGQPLYGAAAL